MVVILATSVNPLFVGAAGLPANFVAANRTLPAVVAQVLPVPLNPAALTQSGVIPGVSSIITTPNSLVINQNQPRTVIDWKSFNIGANSWVYFKQQQPDWIALNRIYDLNPSQIYGKLQADGKIYLINQNGILFGAGSQINVHSLIASTLNFKMADSAFLNPATAVNLTFKGESYQTDAQGIPVPFDPASAVSNLGTIRTDDLGSVFLLAPKVENAGSISSPMGQIGLVAGTDLALAPDTSGNSTRTALVARVNGAPGLVVNQETGLLEANNGLVGMYGGTVQQQGIIRSITAVKVNGQIELKASELVQTGAKSITETPPDTSTEKVNQTFPYNGGSILIGGLDSDDPTFSSASATRIDHAGMISSPSGTVTLRASQRATFEAGSSIDVSGLWVDKPAGDRMISVMLGSVVLRDAQQQKSGILLGKTVTVDPLTGSAIGDISGSLTSQDLTTLDRSVTGGTITVSVPSGDIVSSPLSKLNFAGGGFRYGAGEVAPTWLKSGSKAYEISTAPSQLAYDLIASTQTFKNSKFGISKSYSGLYLGGVSPVGNFISNYVEGADGGTATLSAKRVDLYGSLDGHVTRGFYQNFAAELTNSLGQQTTLGRAEPGVSTLTIGVRPIDDPSVSDPVVDSIIVRQNVVPLDHDTPVSGTPQVSMLSASILNAAGLGAINIFANYSILIDNGAHIAMNPGSVFTAEARRIEHRGEIDIPGGSVILKSKDNKTNFVTTDSIGSQLVSKVYLDSGSIISVAGERLNLRQRSNLLTSLPSTSHISGGSVTLQDDTDAGVGTIIRAGASVDVSGGYLVDTKGKVTGGNAGTVALQGDAIVLDGDLTGKALPGKKGGTVVLHAGNVEITPNLVSLLPQDFTANSTLPVNRQGTMILDGDRFLDSGFTNLDIRGRNDLVVDVGAHLRSSLVRLPLEDTTTPAISGWVPANRVTPLVLDSSPDYLGASSVSLSAGIVFSGKYSDAKGNLVSEPKSDSTISINNLSTIVAGPGGSITLADDASSQGSIRIAGELNAPGGAITVKAGQNLTVETGARISAAGYLKQNSSASIQGISPAQSPISAGGITLKATRGDLNINTGTFLDISGASPVDTVVVNASGTIGSINIASDPGSLSLSYAGTLTMNGTINAKPQMTGVRGGSLTIRSLNYNEGYTLDPLMVTTILKSGFDDLTFGSVKNINLVGSFDLSVGRSLILDAPAIVNSGNNSITLNAPWVHLVNSSLPPSTSSSAAGGGSHLSVRGDWVDISGKFSLLGFADTTVTAGKDISFSDTYYQVGGTSSYWSGLLSTGGDLTLTASRIYPTTQSNFTINSEGKVTILPGSGSSFGPILSAGGLLAINARQGIEHRGTIAAPFGEIDLNSDPSYAVTSRVYLAEGSLLTTFGDSKVPFGFVDADKILRMTDKQNSNNSTGIIVGSAPVKSVSINGKDVIIRENAVIDTSGGGTVFSYLFQPGVEGTFNPLTGTGRYIILSDNRTPVPGNAVNLFGTPGLGAGTYSLLSEQYAFLPGAMVITDLGPTITTGLASVTKEGYPVVTGYATFAGSTVHSSVQHSYSVRPATDVIKEGNFSYYREINAGDAGNVTIRGTTTILNGSITAAPLPEYSGGTLSLSGQNITVASTTTPLPADFNFTTPFDRGLTVLEGSLNVAAASVSGKGFREIDLGVIDPTVPTNSTNNITLKQGSTLSAPLVKLVAGGTVTLESGSQIEAIDAGGNGTASIRAKTLTVQANAQIHASDQATLVLSSFDPQGANPIKVDRGVLSLAGKDVYLGTDSYLMAHPGLKTTNPGFYLTDSLWQGLSNYANISLTALNDLVFLGDFTLAAKGYLSLNAARISIRDAGIGGVRVSSGELRLMNDSGVSTATSGDSHGLLGVMNISADSAVISLNAIDTVGSPRKGDLVFSGFGAINLTIANGLTLAGNGMLKTNGGDLNFTSARVTTSYYQDASTPYRAAGFTLDAGSSGMIRILRSNGVVSGTTVNPGGFLTLIAKEIVQGGTVEVASGIISYAASGNITMQAGAEILARGVEYPIVLGGAAAPDPGGQVNIRSSAGAVVIDSGAKIDVSAAGSGDAGSITLSAPVGRVAVAGELKGTATGGGSGGSFQLDTTDLTGFNGFSALNSDVIVKGGFTTAVDIRTRNGDLSIAAGDTLKARSVTLSVDGGNLDLQGTIDATALQGGHVEIYAGNNVNINGAIDAHATGTGSMGGEVIVGAGGFDISNAPIGQLTMTGGAINVSGNGIGSGGSVTFRAPRSVDMVNAKLEGTVTGATQVIAEAFKVYQRSTVTMSDAKDTWLKDAGTFISNNKTGFSGLILKGGQFHLRPGVDISSTGDLAVADNLDFTSQRFNGEPGTLTLRATGTLQVSGNLTDAPTSISNLTAGSKSSWSYTLVGGSDLKGASPEAIFTGQGKFIIDNNMVVYTEGAPIRFASGGDTVIGSGSTPFFMIGNGSMNYSLATYSGTIRGIVGGSLTLVSSGSVGTGYGQQSAIQSATGAISLSIAGDLDLRAGDFLGAIRTTGQVLPSSDSNASAADYWRYGGGGDIKLSVGGAIKGSIDSNAWDMVTYNYDGVYDRWSADYVTAPTAGLATMGGGSLSVRTGGDIDTQAGVFGKGNLNIASNGNLLGRYLSGNGTGEIHVMGNVGVINHDAPALEALDSRIHLLAQGDVAIGTIVNPSVVNSNMLPNWDLKYGADSAVGLTSLTGNVLLSGNGSAYYSICSDSSALWRTLVLPPTLEISAKKDIQITNSFVLAPSSTGNLTLTAGGSIDGTYSKGHGQIIMSDNDPAMIYGLQPSLDKSTLFDTQKHFSGMVSQRNNKGAAIEAGVDITNLTLSLAHWATVTAGNDIRDISYRGQNNSGNDVSSITAGNDIYFSSVRTASNTNTGVLQGGPGALIVQAGNAIDLGTTQGIQSYGNFYNTGLVTKGSDVTVVAGLGVDNIGKPRAMDQVLRDLADSYIPLTPDQDLVAVSLEQRYFDTLRAYGQKASDLSNSGDASGAKIQIETARSTLIKPLFASKDVPTGNINMTSSQISTNSGADAINIITRGVINVGKSTIVLDKAKAAQQQSATGIYTAAGGPINMLSLGDMNVNESRVMTFRGGDITMWSDQGGINAGRGSRTAINAQPPKLVRSNPSDPNSSLVVQFTPPAVGSGIAAKWYNKGLAPETPLMGNIYPFAPSGFIDAGEAGISGNKIAYYAPTVLNAGNFTAASGPAPSASGPGVSLGSLSGTGSMSQATKSMEQSTSMATAGDQGTSLKKKLMDDLVASWLDVKIISFDTPEQTEPQDGPLEKKRR